MHWKKIACLLVVLGSAVAITACQKKQDDAVQEDAAKKSQPTVVAATVAPAVSLPVQPETIPVQAISASVQPAHYRLAPCKGDNCTDIEIKRIETNNPWLNKFLDQQVVQFSSGLGEPAPEGSSLQAMVDDFVQMSREDARLRGGAIPYVMHVSPEFLGQRGALAQFKVSGEYFSGGAHGSAISSYYVLDISQKKQLKLDDVVIKGQKKALYAVLYPDFVAWVKSSDANADVAEYERVWKFGLTDNFSFAKDGLNFQYGQYEIGPYVVGMPEFTVPYGKLNGIIKPEYLANPSVGVAGVAGAAK